MSPPLLADLAMLLAAPGLLVPADRARATWRKLPAKGPHRVMVAASDAARVAAVATLSGAWCTMTVVGGDLSVRCGRPGVLMLPSLPPAPRVLHDAELAPLSDDRHGRDAIWWEPAVADVVAPAIAPAVTALAQAIGAFVLARADLAGLQDAAARVALR